MKTIEYYCSHHFDPASAATMLAPDWLEAKINAAQTYYSLTICTVITGVLEKYLKLLNTG